MALIDRNPDWPWGYIGWSDEYRSMKNGTRDYTKAETILKRALARPNLSEQAVVRDRLRTLHKERVQVERPKRRKRNRRRRRGAQSLSALRVTK